MGMRVGYASTKGTASDAPEDFRELKGTLRFPLDVTSHGCR